MDLIDFICCGLPVWSLAILLPMLFLAGFVDAIGGGGGLISLPAYLFCGLPAHVAIGTNKLSSTMGTCIATAKYALNGYIPWKTAGVSVIAALIGSSTGANLALAASETTLFIFMLIALPFVGFYVLAKKDLKSDKEPLSRKLTIVICLVIAFCMGVYDGFYGPGTGTFLLLLLTGVARIDVFKAAGVTKAINLATNVAALVVFLMNGTTLVALGIVGGLANMCGNYLGARMFTSKGTAIVRPIILVVLAAFAIRLICELADIV